MVDTKNSVKSKSTLKTWKSFEQKQEQPSDIEQKQETTPWKVNSEFPDSVGELIARGARANLNRKSFLTLMGASISMMGIGCTKQPAEKIVPYSDRPLGQIPGVATWYASSRAGSESVTPVLVKTQEGKPRFIDGMEEHPIYKGAVSGDTIATIWDLYDPDRIKDPQICGVNKSWKEAIVKAKSMLYLENIRILTRASFSPSETKVRNQFAAGKCKVVSYDPVGNLAEQYAGNQASFGKGDIPLYEFDKPDWILSLEADFLGSWLATDLYTKQFASRRDPDENMNRLIVVETTMSVTGSNADTRVAVHSGTAIVFALGLVNLITKGKGLGSSFKKYTPKKVSEITGAPKEKVEQIAKELLSAKGRGIVVAGGITSRNGQEGSLTIVANLLNSILENEGKIIPAKAPLFSGEISTASEIEDLRKELISGKVDTLIIDRANPAYELPGFASAIAKAKNIIFIGTQGNESMMEAKVILPSAHYLEAWSDTLSHGNYSIVQPTIRPLFNVLSAGDIWLGLQGQPVWERPNDAIVDFTNPQNIEKKRLEVDSKFYAIIKKTAGDFGQKTIKDFDNLLSNGFITAEKPGGSRLFLKNALSKIKAPIDPPKGQRLSLYQSVSLKDGSGANNAFRHELPDPITKMTWQNVLLVSPRDAKENNWRTGNVLRIKSGKKELELAAFVQPGMRGGNFSIAIGYGQKNIGRVNQEKATEGRNAYVFAEMTSSGMLTSSIPVEVEKIDSGGLLPNTQRHHELGIERGVVRQANLSDYKKNKKAGQEAYHVPPGKGLYTPHKYEGNRWHLNIDLSKCTGCSACVVACYSENNIPVVGPDDVRVGREMSWLRIDRYYGYTSEEAEKADPDMVDPSVLFQPMMCQHCENAPCENVCPVGATAHSQDGLNYMTYNRCIGTRYCANNCPYKVRRFNFFEYWEGKIKDPQHYALNPQVTVRSRGVIEKCSLCQERIYESRRLARMEDRELRDCEVKLACQTSCSSGAITFGDINLKGARILSKLPENNERSYKVLAEIKVDPAISYQVRIKNQG